MSKVLTKVKKVLTNVRDTSIMNTSITHQRHMKCFGRSERVAVDNHSTCNINMTKNF